MPLTMARTGEQNYIRKIGGREQTRRHLENLGFVVGRPVTLIAEMGGNVIVSVMGSRIAVSREMADKILV